MARGISTGGDVIEKTVDGVDTSSIWTEMQAAVTQMNAQRDNLTGLLTVKTTTAADAVAQTLFADQFERSSEFGVPVGVRAPGAYVTSGYPLEDFDIAGRYSYRFMRDADAAQIEAVHQLVLEADNRNVYGLIMRALFNPTARLNKEGIPVVGLWSGDGTAPPPVNGVTFDGSHSHYLTSGASVVHGQDVTDIEAHISEHGYGDPGNGERILVLANPQEGDALRSVVKGDNSSLDFIAGEASPAFLTQQTLIGSRAPATLGTIPLFGSIGRAWLGESSLVPRGYLLGLNVSPSDGGKPVALREHLRPELRGLRLVKGRSNDYPLQDSYYERLAGAGVRLRGAACIMQVTANASYAVPAEYS